MPMHNLYPPGRVLWAVRESDVSYAAPPPAERRYNPMESLRAQREEAGTRLFEVLDVEKVFTQIIFARDMVRYGSCLFSISAPNETLTNSGWGSSHMAHTYDKIIEELQ
jgi:sn1-specific diacylglycerol lipase